MRVSVLKFLSHLSGDEVIGRKPENGLQFLSHLSGDEATLSVADLI